jgi:ferredoxin-thioredoxin reductase catalytic subunit
MEVEELYEMLRKMQEPKGYFFSRDKEWVLDILRGLLKNKERYGYMSCPCRLASGDRRRIRTLSVPASIERPMWKNTEAATAISMSRRNGTKIRFHTCMCRKGDLRRKTQCFRLCVFALQGI